MHWSQFQKFTKLYQCKKTSRKYIRKLESSEVESIQTFFHSDDASFPLLDKKFVGKRFMKRSIQRSWKMYNLLPSTTRKIAMNTFMKYRPKQLQGKIPFRQSCCEVCQNFEFVIDQGSKYLQGIPRTLDESVDSSMCGYSDYFPKVACTLQKCSECGVNKLKQHLITLNSEKLFGSEKEIFS